MHAYANCVFTKICCFWSALETISPKPELLKSTCDRNSMRNKFCWEVSNGKCFESSFLIILILFLFAHQISAAKLNKNWNKVSTQSGASLVFFSLAKDIKCVWRNRCFCSLRRCLRDTKWLLRTSHILYIAYIVVNFIKIKLLLSNAFN